MDPPPPDDPGPNVQPEEEWEKQLKTIIATDPAFSDEDFQRIFKETIQRESENSKFVTLSHELAED